MSFKKLPSSHSASGTSSPAQHHIDDFSFADAPRHFKNPYYKKSTATGPGGAGGRRNKSLKLILAGERDRVDRVAKELRESGVEGKDMVEVVTCELGSWR